MMTRRLMMALAAAGLVTLAIPGEGRAFPDSGRSRAKYEVEVLVNGVPVPEYVHGGRNYVMGREGDRYAIRIRNNTRRRIEVIATVDGLDVIDGKKADYVRKRGYVLGPWQTYDVEGFRLSMSNVAAFRFSSVADSYAARKGDARNVGVIGVAIFPEKKKRRPKPRPVRPRDGYGRGWERRSSADRNRDSEGSSMGDTTAEARSGAAGLSSRSSDPRREQAAKSRPGLGTEFGESRYSQVHETTFRRANRKTPSETIVVRYNDYRGLLAMGVPVDEPCCGQDEAWTRHTADPFPDTPYRYRTNDFSTPPAGWRR